MKVNLRPIGEVFNTSLKSIVKNIMINSGGMHVHTRNSTKFCNGLSHNLIGQMYEYKNITVKSSKTFDGVDFYVIWFRENEYLAPKEIFETSMKEKLDKLLKD